MFTRALFSVAVILSLVGCLEALAFFGLRPHSIPIGDYSYAIAFADRAIRREMSRLDIPGVVVVLVDDQEMLWHGEYGVKRLESGDPITLDTMFNAGSVAKLFTGIEVMKMYEEGVIDLDVPIASYLPEFAPQSRWTDVGAITTRQILAHRSGLPRNGALLGWHFDDRPYILASLTNSLSVLYPAYPPERRYKYSNIGYDVLGRLIEVIRGIDPPDMTVVSGFPYYLEESLFDPIGMESTGSGSEALRYGVDSIDRAVGYYRSNGAIVAYDQFDIINLPSGNLHTTARDLTTFAHFILAEGMSETGSLIGSETLASMFEPHFVTPSDPQTNGLAWFTDEVQLGEKIVFHSGTGQGCRTLIALAPESKVGIILMGNADAFEEVYNQLAFDTLGLLIETKTGSRIPESESPNTVSIDSETLESYAGTYIVDSEIVEIAVSGNRLAASFRGRSVRLLPIDTNRFTFGARVPGIEESEISFWESDLDGELRVMILSLARSYHKACPQYDRVDAPPSLWYEISGNYEIAPRYATSYGESDSFGIVEFAIDDGMLVTSSGMYLDPIDETIIRIVGGIFDGELMDLDLSAGTISWQNLRYTRGSN